MARYTGPVCRLCRREGEKLFLKGERCFSSKCAIEKRDGPPGVQSKRRGRFSEYRLQLREKQKVKRMYGMLEKQFRATFHEADRKKGVTGETLLQLLESRLDNMIYRAGIASSRAEGRQRVRHGLVVVNDQVVTIPSYSVKPGDVVKVKDKAKEYVRIRESVAGSETRPSPAWLEIDRANLQFTVRSLPTRDQLTHPIKEQLIVELYSK